MYCYIDSRCDILSKILMDGYHKSTADAVSGNAYIPGVSLDSGSQMSYYAYLWTRIENKTTKSLDR